MPQYKRLDVGDPAPHFKQRCTSNEDYSFDSAAGRYLVLCFFVSAGDEGGQEMLRILEDDRDLFDDKRAAFFGISIDPEDEKQSRVREIMPGIRYFWDFDYKVSKEYGSIPVDAVDGKVTIRRFWMVLDPMMRVAGVFDAAEDHSERHQVAAFLRSLPPIEEFAGFPIQAPVIILPNVFEPEFCTQLIYLYNAEGGEESGFMRDVDGRTKPILDYGHKRRSDVHIDDDDLRDIIQQKVVRRVVPEIRKAHNFEVTRMERYIIGCYDSATKGHFRPHRDNTTKGTAHRRFALSINLNDDFDGGEVSFPEYGPRGFKAPPGGAVIFSCGLLHEVSQVTRGKRYAFLPFLYDDAAAQIRLQNNPYLDESVGDYEIHDADKDVAKQA